MVFLKFVFTLYLLLQGGHGISAVSAKSVRGVICSSRFSTESKLKIDTGLHIIRFFRVV